MLKMNQKGFTLIELLLAMAIMGLLLPVMVNSIRQIIVDTDRNTTNITALVQVEAGARVLGKDIRSAQTTDLVSGAGPVSSMTLTRTDWSDMSSFDVYADGSIIYPRTREVWSLAGTDLQSTTGTCSDWDVSSTDDTGCNVSWVDDTPRTIVRYVTSAEFSLDAAEEVITAKYTSSPDPLLGATRAQTYTLNAFARFMGALSPVQ